MNKEIRKLLLAAMFLALGYILPFFTGQIPTIGSMLLPMHIPVLLCGFICGPKYGLLIGIILPISRSMVYGMPPMFPVAIAMTFELASYGLVTGIMYELLSNKKGKIIISLLTAMVIGRIAWGITTLVLLGVSGGMFTFEAFLSGALLSAVPGIILQLILIPAVIYALQKAKVIDNESTRNYRTS